jgi:hypothetical protein
VTRREMKARLRAQRKALRAELGQRRAAIKARTTERDATRRQRRLAIALLILILLLLLLLRDCSCAHATGPVRLTAFPIGPGVEATIITPAAEPPFTGRVATTPRPAVKTQGVGPPLWLTSLRIQVAARSPRLAGCFEGTTRPGTLRWTVAVDADRGVVSDPEIEPTLAGQELSTRQRQCVLGVLADPPYRLATGDEPATPARVGLVIEF